MIFDDVAFISEKTRLMYEWEKKYGADYDFEWLKQRGIPVIGIGGPMASGKDHLAAMLTATLNRKYGIFAYRAAFADRLRGMVWNMTRDERFLFVRDWDSGMVCTYPERSMQYRQLLQSVGEAMRAVDQDYFVHALAEELTSRFAESDDVRHAVIIPDVRYLNEAAFVHLVGGILVYISIASATQMERLHSRRERVNLEVTKHVSEKQPILASGAFDMVFNAETMKDWEIVEAVLSLLDKRVALERVA
jgi:dephospho-CoA kinase